MTTLRLVSIVNVAADTNTYEFQSVDGATLAPYEPGAHIRLHLPNMSREYSLTRPYRPGEGYVVGIKLDRASKGGSRYIHETLKVGDILDIDGPKNNFPLHTDPEHAILIAGGIGITPIWCMAQQLAAARRPYTLYYAVRTIGEAAFLDDMRKQLGDRLHLHVDDEEAGEFMAVEAIVAGAPAGAHHYCCGPLPMLETFENATASLPRERVHVEYFSAPEAPATEGGFTVVLARSGREIPIQKGITILEALRQAGLKVPASCEQGVCGTCETKVVAGRPDHRDILLTPAEKASNKTMMICCSGSLDPKLVLDL